MWVIMLLEKNICTVSMLPVGEGDCFYIEFELSNGRFFLISTDGKKHSQPNKETIAKIICRDSRETRYLCFNYKHPIYYLFCNQNAESMYRYKVISDNEKIILGGDPIEL